MHVGAFLTKDVKWKWIILPKYDVEQTLSGEKRTVAKQEMMKRLTYYSFKKRGIADMHEGICIMTSGEIIQSAAVTPMQGL